MDWFSVPQDRNNRSANSSPVLGTGVERAMSIERTGTESWSSFDEANKCGLARESIKNVGRYINYTLYETYYIILQCLRVKILKM